MSIYNPMFLRGLLIFLTLACIGLIILLAFIWHKEDQHKINEEEAIQLVTKAYEDGVREGNHHSAKEQQHDVPKLVLFLPRDSDDD